MKLAELEQLLNMPYEAELEIKNVPLSDITEFAKYFGVEVKDLPFSHYAKFKRNSMTVTLNSPFTSTQFTK